MPRRRPSELRFRRSDVKKKPPGLPRGSARLLTAVAALERNGFDSVGGALRNWRLNVQGRWELTGCDHCDWLVITARETLDSAMRALPPPLARELGAMVAPLDELYEARTVPDPAAPSNAPAWSRRTRS
ncbi:hypothetical protein [Kutzneria chonburiensis]|uniref:Uncharacterized protein n=1 Tax=Kutzneria chonburiensis TaxID=1483604 RepID=A0ABV6NAV8_9PSEU|nr:hypothetical protein [Kutzneria chonburiensis]